MKTAEKIRKLKVKSSLSKYDPALDVDEKIWESLKKDVKKARAQVYAETYGK